MISVVLATYNEAKNIARCLESVKGFASEIIVVDGSSQDETQTIARTFGAQVISTTNKSNFHINKQMAMDAAKGELVLQLDADEVVDEQLIQFIQVVHNKLQSDQLGPVAAWYIKRRNFFLSRFLTKGGQYPDPVIRLYVNGKARLPQENVHEQMTVDGKTEFAEGHLLHYPYPDFASYMRKFNAYTSFEAERQASQQLEINNKTALRYFVAKPLVTFFQLYFRHKGFVDGMPGLVFAMMSSLHPPFVFLKLIERRQL